MFFLLHKITIQALDNYCVIYLKFTTIFEITTHFNYFFKDRNVEIINFLLENMFSHSFFFCLFCFYDVKIINHK